MSKDVRKPGSDNWEKSETGGRFIRDVVIVAAVLAGGFGWYYTSSQKKAEADKTAKVAKDLLLKDDPKAYAQAEAKLKEVLALDSSHGYSLAALAELNAILYVDHNVGDRKGAASEFVAKAVAEKTSTAEEYAAKAMMMTAEGKAAEAEKFLTAEVLDKGAGGARIYAALGEALRAQGKLEEARRAFKAAFDADWRNPRFAVLIGESYLEEGDATNALAYFSKGLQSNSEHLGSMLGAARARIANGAGLKEAGDAIKSAMEREAELTPSLKARALVAKAELELFEQKVDDAIATAHAAAQADATDPWSFAVKAKAEASKKDANAITSFEKAIAADAYVAAFYFDAAKYLLAAELDSAKAISFLEQYPLKKDDKYFLEFGNALRRTGKLDDALAKYELGIKENEVNGALYVAKGSILREQSKFDEAEKAFEAAQAAQEFNPDLYVEKAMLRFAKKEYEQGMQEYATALTQWRQAKASREQLTAAIAQVKDLLAKAGQRQYAQVWETEATQLIR
ncbi:tetratricopeptide repeat protein [Vulgatibacter sp.]|uniref:tetratricopeptide repeat protein n=1 Tax=Vulgatibacter sp. TaxID=1971226 RepID=UPI00356ABDDA